MECQGEMGGISGWTMDGFTVGHPRFARGTLRLRSGQTPEGVRPYVSILTLRDVGDRATGLRRSFWNREFRPLAPGERLRPMGRDAFE